MTKPVPLAEARERHYQDTIAALVRGVVLLLDSDRVDRKLDVILAQLRSVRDTQTQELAMDAATQASLDNLNAKVADQTTIETSIETLLTGLSQAIADLKKGTSDPAVIAALDAAAAIVSRNNDAAAAAVVANTPTP